MSALSGLRREALGGEGVGGCVHTSKRRGLDAPLTWTPLSLSSQLAPSSLPARLCLKYYSLKKKKNFILSTKPVLTTPFTTVHTLAHKPLPHLLTVHFIYLLFVTSLHYSLISCVYLFMYMGRAGTLGLFFSQLHPQHLEQRLTHIPNAS